MFGMGFPELLVILVACLLVFGPGKIPEVAEALGKSVRDFQRALKPPPDLPPSPSASSAEEKPPRPSDNS
jgi:sec-independent protein translocase protein TatA